MSDQHIINILENAALTSLSEAELYSVRTHTQVCLACKSAYEAAQISTILLKEKAQQTFAPPPFFQTRVLAKLRQRQEEPWTLGRLWRAAGAIASSMAVTVASLAVLTLFVPADQIVSNSPLVSSSLDSSAEEVILDQNNLPDEQISDDEVFTTLYGTEQER